jgi:molybdopterin-containing oxidoreductase family iron-sulfur binding subunit
MAKEAVAEVDALMRMQDDLERALAKPMEQRRWAMVVDTRKCMRCFACQVACVAENVTAPDVFYRTVPEVQLGSYPNVQRIFMPANCMQCDKPPCVDAANAVVPGSMEKRPDGIVAINYEKFRGREVFEAARRACPYQRAIYYDEGRFFTDGTPRQEAYESRASFEYERGWVRADEDPPIGSGRKCHFCLHRLEAGMLPACVTTCIGGALFFGDLADPQSVVSRILREEADKVMRVWESFGTEPRVFYLSAMPLCKQHHA